MPIGDSDRPRTRSTRQAEKKGAGRGVGTMGVQIPPYRKRYGNDFISVRAGDRTRREKNRDGKSHGGGVEKNLYPGMRETESSKRAIGKWTRENENYTKLEVK